jgi:hypothetical protein
VKVNSAATNFRPEDAAFAQCRANSALSNGTINGGGDDGLDGLGYNPNNAPGVCPQFVKGGSQAPLVGTAVKSGYPGSTALVNIVAFNVSGQDPFTGLLVYPAGCTTIPVGTSPLTFVFQRSGSEASGGLTGLTDATDTQLPTVFSDTDCDAASVFGLGTAPNPIAAYLYDPISGQGQTAEATVFRRPVTTILGSPFIGGISQETNVGGINPLSSTPCVSGVGTRSRAIATGEEIKSVQNSFAKNATDGIGYLSFSFGNASSLQNSPQYGYITLNRIDPLFANYAGTEPGPPGNGILPGSKKVCGKVGFPCSESAIWSGGLSYPNLRNGTYDAWTVIRIVTSGTANVANRQGVVNSSQQFVFLSVPDYVPAKPVLNDPGLQLVRSHYQQLDGNGANLGPAPNNGPSGEAGGDLGGCILAVGSSITGDIQSGPGTACTRGRA